MAIKPIKQAVEELCERVGDLEGAADLDEQTLSVDCDAGTLDISNGNSVDLADLGQVLVYRYEAPDEPGLRARFWDNTAGPHLDPLEWDGPADPDVGFSLPVAAAPNLEVVSNSTNISDAGEGVGGSRYAIIDGWVFLPDDVTHLRDNNTQVGELGMVLLGKCCGGSLAEQPGGNHTVGTDSNDRSLMDSTPITGGWHYVYSPQSDFSANNGLDLEYSTDNEGSWADVTIQQPDTPTVETQLVKACDLDTFTADGWQVEPLTECCQPTYSAGGGLGEDEVQALIDASATPHVEPSTLAPIADNEVDTAIRSGQVGTSLDYARADHNHPIRRQGNPGDITLTPTNLEIVQATLILDRWSDEESYAFNTRTRVSQDAGTGWGWLNVPLIAGFQQPQILYIGTYRNPSTTPQDDDGTFGAAPRGPFMGSEAHHWSSTNRIYMGYSRRDNDLTSVYVEAVIKYVRN